MSKFYTNVHQYGNSLYIRGKQNGVEFRLTEHYLPTLYTNYPSVRGQTPTFTSLNGTPLYAREFQSINDARDAIKNKPSNVDMYGSNQHRYDWISENFEDDIKWDKDQIKLFSIDIETSTENGFPDIAIANEEILLITVKDNNTKQIITFGTRPFTPTRNDHKYMCYESEHYMLRSFMHFWENNYPDVITGWNINGFDIPYLVHRIERVCGEHVAKKLSPFNYIKDKGRETGKEESLGYIFAGIASLDYLQLYKKFTYTNRESYRLDFIAEVELGENKLKNPEDNFKDFYTKHWDTFVKYNIHDVELVDKLEDKMRLIELAYTLAYTAKINYEDVFSPVRMWDMIIYNYLLKRRIAIPMREENVKSEAFEGAYVKDPLVGPHRWIASFDLNSLYPHLIMQYNMSPETLVQQAFIKTSVEELLRKDTDTSPAHKTDLAFTANGWCYRKDVKGFLPELMEEMYANRSKFKKQMLKVEQEYQDNKSKKHLLKEISRLNNMQMAMKIALNSAYGAVGNRYFRYYDLRIAEGITTSGQLSIRWMANKLNAFMNKTLKTEGKDYVIAIDTDSIYLSLETLVEKVCAGKTDAEKIQFMDKICDTVIQPVIDDGYQELATYMNAYAQKMQMKREVLADKGIWVAKKRYVLNVHNSEGVQYAEPKIKVMGLEMVKSSTPAIVRQKLKDALKVILYKQESDLQDFVASFKSEFSQLPVEEIAFPRSISDLNTYTDKASIYGAKCPIHVRGALLYNHYVKQNKLDKKYELIGNGDKIKFVYLMKRNPINENVISFLNEFPNELNLKQYIDYDLQFEKTFTDAIDIVVRPLGWNSERQAQLDLW